MKYWPDYPLDLRASKRLASGRKPSSNGYLFERLLADKSYDSDDILQLITAKEAEALIPPQAYRKERREYDKHWYKEHPRGKSFIKIIKHYG